jgi:FMNH2-dependent dimethyl sulfone monooxygenase
LIPRTHRDIADDELAEHRARTVPLFNGQKLKLGVFGANISHGLSMTHAETSFHISWEHTRAIARQADRMGFELLLPVARWRGFGGTTDFNGESFESYTWAAGLAAETRQIMVFSTSHVFAVHPIIAAKMATTIDHISGGRFGLNLVMGWFTPENAMLGIPQLEHDERYAFGSEWLAVAKRLWAEEEPSDFEGRFFKLRELQAHPKPIQRPRPVLINAGSSAAGVDFSAREVDFNFATVDTPEGARAMVRRVNESAAEYKRKVGVMGYGYVICRDTEAEARAVHADIVAKGDRVAAKNLADVLGIQSQSYNDMVHLHDRFIAGWGGYPLIGTPDMVTSELVKLSEAGLEGLVLSFLDFDQELRYFDAAVMPRLRQAGLRT